MIKSSHVVIANARIILANSNNLIDKYERAALKAGIEDNSNELRALYQKRKHAIARLVLAQGQS